MPEPFKMPEWMRPFARHITNTGDAYSGEPPDEHFVQVVEAMMNRKVNARINLALAMLQSAVESQVILLGRLHARGLLVRANGGSSRRPRRLDCHADPCLAPECSPRDHPEDCVEYDRNTE